MLLLQQISPRSRYDTIDAGDVGIWSRHWLLVSSASPQVVYRTGAGGTIIHVWKNRILQAQGCKDVCSPLMWRFLALFEKRGCSTLTRSMRHHLTCWFSAQVPVTHVPSVQVQEHVGHVEVAGDVPSSASLEEGPKVEGEGKRTVSSDDGPR